MHSTDNNAKPTGRTEAPSASPDGAGETVTTGSARGARSWRTILVDPPWGTPDQRGKFGAQSHYRLMSLEDIRQLPVGQLADDNAHLYLWCYPATRYIAEDIMRGWGFRFVDEFVWGKDQFGLGQYFRHAHETLLLGVKGRLPVQFRGQRSFTMLPRQSHSHKPEEVHVMVQRLSPGPYLELFARRPAPTNDWDDVWGDSVASTVSIPGYPVPSDISKADSAGAASSHQEAENA